MSVRVTSDRADLIDEAGRIGDELAAEDAAHAAKTSVRRARLTALQSEIVGWFEKEPPESEHAPAGDKYVAEIGPKGNRSYILSVSKLYRRLGRFEFLKHAEIPLGTLRCLLPKAEHEQFIRTLRTGNRSLNVIKKAS